MLVAAVIGVGMWQASRPVDVTVPTTATADGTGLSVGSGPVTVELYLDFLCPVCKQFHDIAKSTLDGYLADGTVTLVYRPIAILDRLSSTKFSTRAASAAGCASDSGELDAFVTAMMANQPAEGSAGLSDDEMVQIGAGAGLTDADFGQCVRDGTHRDWATANTETATARGVQSTPTVFVDGVRLESVSVSSLVAAIDAAAPPAG